MTETIEVMELAVSGGGDSRATDQCCGVKGSDPIDPGSRGQGSKGQKVKLTRQKAVCDFGPSSESRDCCWVYTIIDSQRVKTALLELTTRHPAPRVPHRARRHNASHITFSETLEDGSAIILGGDFFGGHVNSHSNWATVLLDSTAQEQQSLQDIPDAVNIMPDVLGNYTEEDPLPEGRSMGSLILLPDGTIWMGNGAATGTAGNGNTTYTVAQSYADNALLSPAIYNSSAPSGSWWSRNGLSASTIPRMYHSSATLLPDSSVFVSGSNPNSDYNATAKFPTEYRVATFYPVYYNKPRPALQNLPITLTYGGAYWNLSLTSTDLAGTPANIQNAKLDSSYTGNADGSGTLHVAQLPPNAAILAPGLALLFVVVNSVPSLGEMIMVGNGEIGKQLTLSSATLPSNATTNGAPTTLSSRSSGGGSSSSAAVKTDVCWAIGVSAATMNPPCFEHARNSLGPSRI
ncbi:copper radical oxidase [Athelia psychrophila]|uniref:Copper radical oxidase n=1 Tax=Athelia psychrophila TaxID=1759441 RepID=A0A166IHX6_9AGAM|nr:copper radical oxidase [Fibularhizoctonia sp. CBS 109695]